MTSTSKRLARDAKAAGAPRRQGRRRARAPPRCVAIAAAVDAARADILAANAEDVAAAAQAGSPPPMIDRLRLDDARVAQDRRRACARSPRCPIRSAQTVKEWTRPNGLRVARRRIPLGVIAIIYESRPNVTTDAAALCLRAGNAMHPARRLAKRSARTARSLAAVARRPRRRRPAADAVQLVPTTDRAAMAELLQRDEQIDLVIPRGGEELIRFVAEHSRIPVIKHYRGNCHVFVERTRRPRHGA